MNARLSVRSACVACLCGCVTVPTPCVSTHPRPPLQAFQRGPESDNLLCVPDAIKHTQETSPSPQGEGPAQGPPSPTSPHPLAGPGSPKLESRGASPTRGRSPPTTTRLLIDAAPRTPGGTDAASGRCV
jgi:hypothetical protein